MNSLYTSMKLCCKLQIFSLTFYVNIHCQSLGRSFTFSGYQAPVNSNPVVPRGYVQSSDSLPVLRKSLVKFTGIDSK